ncbi:MAG: hypothetical protein ACI4P3_01750 [Candidatus Spyradosoma sp.]
MANYLLECEIVGGEIVHIKNKKASSNTYKVRIIPNDIFGRSNLISPDNRFGILIEEDVKTPFSAKNDASVEQIPLDENGQASLNVSDLAIFNAILACRGSRVVLKLEEGVGKIVGFKARF